MPLQYNFLQSVSLILLSLTDNFSTVKSKRTRLCQVSRAFLFSVAVNITRLLFPYHRLDDTMVIQIQGP
jgi:hypothetical protein